MSKEVVDATIKLASYYRKPILLIASRRQVDSAEFNNGYVQNWNIMEFARYVIRHDFGGYIAHARDLQDLGKTKRN